MATHSDSVFDSSVGAEKAREGRKAPWLEMDTDNVLSGVAYVGAGVAVYAMPHLCAGLLIATGLLKFGGIVVDRWL